MNEFSFYKAQAQGLHDRWISTLRDMRDASAPVQFIFRDDLKEIYAAAQKLYTQSLDKLDPLSRSLLEHMLARSIDQHFAITTSK